MKDKRFLALGVSVLVVLVVVMVSALGWNLFDGQNIQNGEQLEQVSTPEPQPVIDLHVNPAHIARGQSATLSWNVTQATSCQATGGWAGSMPMQGSVAISPNTNEAYTLTCENIHRRAHRTVEAVVGAAVTACSDGVDNDGDGLIDMADPGCTSATDTDEFNLSTTH